MKDKKNRKIDTAALLRGSFRLPRMSEPKRFWNAFRAKAELTPQDRESLIFGASERPSRMARWSFSKVAAGLLVLFALYTLIEDYFSDPEPIEVAEEEVAPEPPSDPPILYEPEADEEPPSVDGVLEDYDSPPPYRDFRREREETPERRLRQAPRPEERLPEQERAESLAEEEAPRLGVRARGVYPAVKMDVLRVRLISFPEEGEEVSKEHLSDLLPLLRHDYDRQSYRVEKEKTFKPVPGESVELGRGFSLAIEEVDDSRVILLLRGRRTADGEEKEPLRKHLQTPLTEPLIVGPFQGRTGQNYILALTVDE